MEKYASIGTKIKAARKAAKMTQKELGEIIGVSPSAIMRYEKNERKLSIAQLEKIRHALNRDSQWMMECVAIVSAATPTDEKLKAVNEVLSETVHAYMEGQTNNLNQPSSVEKEIGEVSDKAFAEAVIAIDDLLGGNGITAILIDHFHKFNNTGRQEAIKRVSELAQLAQYTRKEGNDDADPKDKETR